MQPSPWAGTVRSPSVRVRMGGSCPCPAPGNPRGWIPGSNQRGGPSLGQRTQAPDPRGRDPARSPMNPSLRRTLAVGGLSVVTAGLLAAPAQAAPAAGPLAPVQDFLAGRL